MIIVAGYLTVSDRVAYLDGCVEVVRLARSADGSLDFALGADLIDPSRINVYECWSTREELAAFRGSGTRLGPAGRDPRRRRPRIRCDGRLKVRSAEPNVDGHRVLQGVADG
ncbi:MULTISPECIES: antibiotic biosynthesis monooxygenase [unclassified Rhodococcus (in: high G+C Gram-positive bacteria)]|uniref:putative quinol monooxygenase n=1 Tax=unclassified Rhodococcus (in: high G+C Gram-positive bacteria) TaxID=192944 RepID=UPI0027DFF74B|nr:MULTISPECIES: antibiotic biosynthesis monooxygenase [unclassified Rhodococcus (in: high G+C Gram-positive bacteria)]